MPVVGMMWWTRSGGRSTREVPQTSPAVNSVGDALKNRWAAPLREMDKHAGVVVMQDARSMQLPRMDVAHRPDPQSDRGRGRLREHDISTL